MFGLLFTIMLLPFYFIMFIIKFMFGLLFWGFILFIGVIGMIFGLKSK